MNFDDELRLRRRLDKPELGCGLGMGLTGGGNTVPALDLNFLSGVLDSRVTFTRGSLATLVDDAGRITFAPNNLLASTEEFDNAGWSKNNATISADVAANPLDGGINADGLAESATTSNHVVIQSVTLGVGVHIVSLYVKAGTRNFVSLAIDTVQAWFNLAIGVVGTVEAGLTAGIVALSGGWYRCYVIRSVTTAGAKTCAIYAANADNVISYAGVTGSPALLLYGAQVEAVTYETTPRAYKVATSGAYHGPRFDYDPVTLATVGLLIEEPRTNLTTYSEQFDNAAWTKSNVTVTANATISPDGGANADKLIAGAGAAVHSALQNISFTSGTGYSISCYVKVVEYTSVALRTAGRSTAPRAVFDLAGGTVSAADADCTATITAAGNGWYRCTIAIVSDTTASAYCGIYPNTNASFTGDGTSGVYIWGFQAEAGAFATSYIPTAASQVTRLADVTSITGSSFANWFNAAEGTMVSVADCPAIGVRTVFSIDDNTSNNAIFSRSSGTDPFFVVISGGSAVVIVDAGAFISNVPYKMANAYRPNDFAAVVDGGVVGIDTAGDVPTVSQLRLGSDGGNYLSGHLRSIRYYRSRLPSKTLQSPAA